MIITVCLEGLEHVLKTGEAEETALGEAEETAGLTNTNDNVYVGLIDDVDGWYKIKELKYHENTYFSEKAVKVFENYFVARYI
jgi:hypothetical protein